MWWRRLLYHLFKVRFVVLQDHDGDLTVCPVYHDARGRPCAQRHGYTGWGIHNVRLGPNGTIESGRYIEYVQRWYPWPPQKDTQMEELERMYRL